MASRKKNPSRALPRELQIKIYDLMVRARALEQRLVKINKSGFGFFWIGGPGEEAFNIPLGLLIQKGEGLDYDFLHFHYRQSATLLAMGMEEIDAIRQMCNTASDPFSGGRNFVNHYSVKAWNVVKVTSPIEVQYSTAIGTGVAQRRHGGSGITIVTGGDAGTAEGDFSSCLVWASRENRELPMLIIVTNNQWGISTPYEEVHCEKTIVARAEGFGIKSATVDGNDVQESYHAIQEAMHYVRTTRKPFFLEANVSRLHGHSSASGGNWVPDEVDCLTDFEKHLKSQGFLKEADFQKLRSRYEEEALEAMKKVLKEPKPKGETIFDHLFVDEENSRYPWPRWLKQSD